MAIVKSGFAIATADLDKPFARYENLCNRTEMNGKKRYCSPNHSQNKLKCYNKGVTNLVNLTNIKLIVF